MKGVDLRFVVYCGIVSEHRLTSKHITIIWTLIFVLCSVDAWGALHALNVAFYYGNDPVGNELQAFDIVVTDPDGGIKPDPFHRRHGDFFAYVSIGEDDPNRQYSKQLKPEWLIGENNGWKTKIIDISQEEWQIFFLNTVIEPLWQRGYRGFFLDTLDSYRLAAKKEDFPRMEAGLAATIRAIHQRHPEARLILNRGFEILDQVKDITFAVAAESLFQNFNPVNGQYGTVSDEDRLWLTNKLNEVKNAGLPVIVIDYVRPGNRPFMRQTAEKIKSLGFSPWVTDKGLASLGVGNIEVIPRIIIGLYDGSEGEGDLFFTNLQRYVVMPLNYLGYTVEMHDLREPLPAGILAGRYAGVIIWPNSTQSGEKQGLKQWVVNCMDQGVPLVFLERFGVTLDADFAQVLGLELVPFSRLEPPAHIVTKDALIGFEQQPLPRIDTFIPMRLITGETLLQLKTANGIVSDAVAITPWGAYVAGRYVVTQMMEEQTAWVLDPFRFFSRALRLPVIPVPDTTTENGIRLLLSHVDGDGFESKAEWLGGRLAAEELQSDILERYKFPTTISLITAVLAPNGLYPSKSNQLENVARGILALPWIEGASHSFSHPFRWKPNQPDTGAKAEIWHAIKIPNYTFNLNDEISGSTRYINERLMPAGKKARIFQWTGNCLPGEDAVRMATEANLLNINGGDTVITDTNRTLTAVGPLGISRGNSFQVYAPNQNENIYTNLWTGNFYEYRRVIETFRLTNEPRRLKPVNIYYHFYSASKKSSLNALKEVYEWAASQSLFGIYTSEYIEKVLDFNRTVIATDGNGWLVRNSGHLRELRIPIDSGYPQLGEESRLAGFNDMGDSRFLHMTPGGEARIWLVRTPSSEVSLISAAGYLDGYTRNNGKTEMKLRGHTPFGVRLAGIRGCHIEIDNAAFHQKSGDEMHTNLLEGSHVLAITCK